MTLLRFSEGAGSPVLEGRLRRPTAPAGRPHLAVLCHPHPAYGGHMDVWLLPEIGRRLADAGWTVLRFNVRGVGGSEPGPGRWDGEEEQHDVAAAVQALRERTDGVPQRVALVGWSFGALLGLRYGLTDPAVTDWVGIAPPTREREGLPMTVVPAGQVERWPARRTIIVGALDDFYPPETTEVLAPHAVHVVDGADHFFFDRDDDVADLVVGALGRAGE